MARIKKSFINAVVGALSAMLPGNKGKSRVNTLGGDTKKLHGRESFQAWWLGLKGAPGKAPAGSTVVPHWRWPDKSDYGQAKDGSIRHAKPQTPFRVRRWRKRAAARLVKANPHLVFSHAKTIVKNMEQDIVKGLVKKNA